MKFRCINNDGYEGRLTLGKVYACDVTYKGLGDFECLLVIITDDGVQCELYPERFEKVETFVAKVIKKRQTNMDKFKEMQNESWSRR